MNDETQRVRNRIAAFSKKEKRPGGLRVLAQMLGKVDRETEQRILQSLEKENPALAHDLREQYFTFDDLLTLSDRVLQEALLHIHPTTLALALKGTSREIQDKVFRNLSKHAGETIREEMEILGRRHKILVEEAQREVTQELRRWKNVVL